MFGEVKFAVVARMAMELAVSRRLAELSGISAAANYDFYADHIVMRLRATLLRQKSVEATENVPLNWWEAFKERWLPWTTVKYRTIETRVTRMCPHIKVPENRSHVEFLFAGVATNGM